jgi:hypothetical protein
MDLIKAHRHEDYCLVCQNFKYFEHRDITYLETTLPRWRIERQDLETSAKAARCSLCLMLHRVVIGLEESVVSRARVIYLDDSRSGNKNRPGFTIDVEYNGARDEHYEFYQLASKIGIISYPSALASSQYRRFLGLM